MGEAKRKAADRPPPDPLYGFLLTTERRTQLAITTTQDALRWNTAAATFTGRTADVTVHLRAALNHATWALELAQAELKEIKEKHDRSE